MSTPEELASTYSFIGPLRAAPILSPYDDNALPLFAVALHLDIEGLAISAIEGLTDHPADKKADIIYVNEAEGIARIAQGFTAPGATKRRRRTKLTT